MKLAIVLALAIATTAHAEPYQKPIKPIWTEQATRHRLAALDYALIAGDVLTTKLAIDKGYKEGNPVLRPIMSALGVTPALSLDALARIWLVHHLAKTEGSNPTLAISGALDALVVANNIGVMNH